MLLFGMELPPTAAIHVRARRVSQPCYVKVIISLIVGRHLSPTPSSSQVRL